MVPVCIHVEYCVIGVYRISCHHPQIITIGFECQETILHSAKIVSRVHRAMNEVPSNTSMARLLKIPDQAGTLKSPMQIRKSNMLSMFTTWRCSVRNWGDLVDLMDSFQADSMKYLFFKFGLALVSSKFATLQNSFYLIPREILT